MVDAGSDGHPSTSRKRLVLAMSDSLASQAASALSHRSWKLTPDRSARTAAARDAGPASIEYHKAKLLAEHPEFADAPDLDKMAESARSEFYAAMALKRARRWREMRRADAVWRRLRADSRPRESATDYSALRASE